MSTSAPAIFARFAFCFAFGVAVAQQEALVPRGFAAAGRDAVLRWLGAEIIRRANHHVLFLLGHHRGIDRSRLAPACKICGSPQEQEAYGRETACDALPPGIGLLQTDQRILIGRVIVPETVELSGDDTGRHGE